MGLSDSLKGMIWSTLGPVKNKQNLLEFKYLLDNQNNKAKSSDEELALKIIEISLKRKQSIGAFFREDLLYQDTAKSSYLEKDKIEFK